MPARDSCRQPEWWTKSARRAAKIALAESKRQAFGTIGYRVLNYYVGTVSPTPGRPWATSPGIPPGALQTEDNQFIVTEDNKIIVSE